MSRLVHQTVQLKEFSDDKLRGEFLDRLRECDVLRALVDVVPAYAKLITTTEPIPEGLGGDVRKILYPAIAHVLRETRKFCRKPILAFFDDVQWIDPGTKGVLSYLLEQNVPVLTIVAYRDRTSQSTFAIESLFSSGDMKASPIEPVGLSLRDLSEKDTGELINYLALSDEDKDALSGAMYKQTEGNPFFLRFRLSMMAETGALEYDVNSRRWRLDKSRVALGTAVTAEDAVEYCATMLRTLDHEASSVLCRLAMMPQGRSLDEYTVTLEHEKGVVALAKSRSCTVAEVIHTAVTFAVQKNLLYHTGRGFRFAHDRLQAGAMQCASPHEAAEIHYYLGKHSLPTSSQYTSEQACQVLDHFSKSREFVTDQDLILRIGTLTTEICAFYVTAGSHEQLDDMIQFARELLQKLDDDKRNSDPFSSLEVRLLIAHHRVKFLMNDLEAAESLFDSVRHRLQSSADIRDAYEARISLLINSSSHHKAIEATAEALALLDEQSLPRGLVLPDGQPAALVGEVTQQIKDIFDARPYCDALQVANSLALSTDEDHNFRVEIMISIIPSMYLIGRFDLYIYVPAIACRSILENGITRSAGNAFSVLGFALVAIFGDSFGSEVAMIGKNLVDRFDNQMCKCRAYCISGIAVVYDQRYEQLASRLLYAAYAAGRTAHDIVWANYSIYLLASTLMFEGVALPKILDKLEDLYAYAMSGHQALAQKTLRSTLHTVSILMQGTSPEEPIFHFSIPNDEVTKSQPLTALSHGALALVALFFDEKLGIAWQIVLEILANDLDKSGPGLPVFFIFHMYAVVVARGVLVGSMASGNGRDGPPPMSDEDRAKLEEVMKSSSAILDNLNEMAPVFTPYATVAKACIVDAIEGKPLDALQLLESALSYVSKEKPGKHYDVVAMSQMISANICKRAKLTSIQPVYLSNAIHTLEKWGAQSVAERLSKEVDNSTGNGSHCSTRSTDSSQASGSARFLNSTERLALANASRTTATLSVDRFRGSRALSHSVPKYAPDFASVLTSASYITSFSSFEELTEKLSSTLMKQATATRFLLLMRHPETGVLEPTAQSTLNGVSSPDTLRDVKYSTPIVKITEQLQEIVVVHSAQQESPCCFESYIQESGVCSVASLPITYQNSLVAVIYMEHEFTQGVFTPERMETMALLGQHVASAIVNARLLRDVRRRTVQLEQSHAFLAKALRVKDTILSNTSHELRTPLNGIIGLNEYMLTSGVDLDPEVQSCMNTTLALARDLLSLVSDILDMSRVNEGALRLNYEATSLRSLVKDVLDVAKFTSNNIHLVNNISMSFPKMMVDPARLKQVILNLTSNALKFTSEGSVTISSELLDDGRMIMIAVTDTGIGIDPAHLDVIFEPFGQVESYETRQHKGAGLGLSITKQLVMIHGGHIDVLSKVGEGTSFRVFIPTTPPDRPKDIDSAGDEPAPRTTNAMATTITHPELINGRLDDGNVPGIAVSDCSINRNANQDKEARGLAPDAHNSPIVSIGDLVAYGELEEEVWNDPINQEPLRVLVVDDTRLNLKILSNVLCKAEMEVTTADSGELLLQKLADRQWINYDVILLDWMMPVMDGITACQLLRKRIPSDLLPVMFLTAKTDPGDITKVFEAGGNDFATKPFNRHEVVARTVSLGRASRRARARYHNSIPIASLILTDSFWKMQTITKAAPMFVICFRSWSTIQEGNSSVIGGPHLLRFFRLGALTFDSEWMFCEVGEDSVTFYAARTTAQQITAFLRGILNGWAESVRSVAPTSALAEEPRCKPLITIGVDHRLVRAYLFAERLPMLVAVDSCVSDAKLLASKGTHHEEILLAESAKAAMATQATCRRRDTM
jgi:signal transduction histidine kinase/predicted ATPase/DNA-binding NarL/FixJ family response regulator